MPLNIRQLQDEFLAQELADAEEAELLEKIGLAAEVAEALVKIEGSSPQVQASVLTVEAALDRSANGS
jgi:hypothetical protein